MTLTTEAKLWSSYVAKNVKVQDAYNPDTIFLIGRTVLDKKTFNRLNNDEDDVVHGVQVIYGPFSSKQSAIEFVSEYKLEWPGDNEWRYAYAGRPEIISSYYDPSMVDIVHNASLDFQGQLAVQEMQRRIEEIESVQKRIANRETEESLSSKPFSSNEKELHIQWQKQKIVSAQQQLEQLQHHLSYIESLPTVD